MTMSMPRVIEHGDGGVKYSVVTGLVTAGGKKVGNTSTDNQ